MWKRLFLVGLIVFAGLYWWTNRPITYGPGVIAAHAPKQINTSDIRAFPKKSYRITPLAYFEIESRVLGVKRYHFGREAELSPIDLALGWGPMSDEGVLKDIKISQASRFYYWKTHNFSISQEEIINNSSNMHMIPSDTKIEAHLKNLRKGQVVKIRGYLVKVEAEDGWHWESSMTRSDSGYGACELVWVDKLNIIYK